MPASQSADAIHRQMAALRSLGPPWERIQRVATSAQIGTREGRRIHGRATVTDEDIREGTKHEDAACRVFAGVDIHSLDPAKNKGIDNAGFKAQPYDISLGALLAKDVDGLLLAGRCISGSCAAHSSYRMSGTAMALGEVAGQVGAAAVRFGVLPHEGAWPDVSRP